MTTHIPLIPLLVVFYQQNIPVLRCIYNGESSMLAPQRRINPLWIELGRAVCGGGNNMRAHNERRNHSPREAPEINMDKYASASKRPCVMSLLGIGHGPDTKSVSFAHSPHWKCGRTENRAAFCDIFPA